MKTNYLISFFFVAIIFVFPGCTENSESLNDYIIAGETTPEQTQHFTFDASIPGTNTDTSIKLDLNADGIDDLKFMNLSFENSVEDDSVFVRRIGIKALGNLQLAHETNPSDSLHFVDTISGCKYAQGEIINQNAPWQPAGHEIMFQHNLVTTTYDDFIYPTTYITRRASVFEPSKPYFGFRLYIDNRYHYGWLKVDHSQSWNGSTISISEAAITRVYTD
ncbi:MAG: hypothetical protein ACQES0_10515 [Bacteroidota bacterium]